MTSKGEAFQYRKNNKVAHNKTPCEPQLAPKQPVPAHIRAGRILYARCRGQPFHVSRILMVDTIRHRCYVRFEDGTTHWCQFSNIQNFDSNESTCCLCRGGSTSLPSSRVVKCDQCKLAFHPECHNPSIDSEQSTNASRKWFCRVCIFSTTSVIHGMSKRTESAPSPWARNASSNSVKHETLEWDEKHRTNKQNIYCYCRKPGRWSESMLQCLKCLQWFHCGCINSLRTKPFSGDAMFVFVCSVCMPSSHEYLRRIQIKWLHVVHLSLFCLGREMNAEERKKKETFKSTFFDVTKDILPWMQSNWKQLMPGMLKGYPKDRREARVTAVLNNHPKKFLKGCDQMKSQNQVVWRLKRDRPPGPPKIWLPDNGAPLTAKLLDRVLLDMGIKCSEQGRLSEKQTSKEMPVNFGSEIGANVNTNCATRLITESSGFGRNSRRLNHVATKTNSGTESAAISPSPSNRNDHPSTYRSANGFPDSHDAESSMQSACFHGNGAGRASAAAAMRTRRLSAFRSNNTRLRKNHLVVGESKFSTFGKSRLNLSKSSADLLLRDRVVKDPENFEILGHVAKANEIAKALKHPKNVVDKEAIDEISNCEVSLSELKSSVGHYFGAASRVARGERCRILGRRTASDGSLQYHVEWEGGMG